MVLINAGGVEKVRKGEKRRDDVRMGPVFTGLFSFQGGARSARSAARRFENRGGRMAAEIGKVSNC